MSTAEFRKLPGYRQYLVFFCGSDPVPGSFPVSQIGSPLAPPIVAAFRYPQCHQFLPFSPRLPFHLGHDNRFVPGTHAPSPLWPSGGLAVFLRRYTSNERSATNCLSSEFSRLICSISWRVASLAPSLVSRSFPASM